MSRPNNSAGPGEGGAWTAPQRGVLVLTLGQALSLAGLGALATIKGLPFLWAHAVMFFWATAVGLNLLIFLRNRDNPGRTEGTFGRWLHRLLPGFIPLLGLAGAAVALYGVRWGYNLSLPSDRPDTVRMAAILTGVAAFFLFFVGRWANSLHRQDGDAVLLSAIHFNWLGIAVHLAGTAVIFLYLYSGIDGVAWTAKAIWLLTAVLVADATVGALTDFYKPPAARGTVPVGHSSLLEWTLTHANPVRKIALAIETTYGVKVREIWALKFLGSMVAPLLLLGLVMAWASTCFTLVPAESEGVRIRLGVFHPKPLAPGLHSGWPWPFERIVIVPTRRIEEIQIGYDEDLGGPILWNERHYRGEKNMLAGNGEELLTVSVLIHYRIADPVAHLLHARGHAEALTHVAYSELVHVLAARESFRVMILEREEIADRMRSTLQADADRFGLGIEILFVGLRDIHPPVDVAPAYQEVVSAEEQRHAMVYGGHKYRNLNMPAAEARSNKLRLEAESKGQSRITRATGEANKFQEIASAFEAAPEFLAERYRLDLLEEILPGRPKIVLDGDKRPPAPAMLYLPLDPGYSMLPLMEEQPAEK